MDNICVPSETVIIAPGLSSALNVPSITSSTAEKRPQDDTDGGLDQNCAKKSKTEGNNTIESLKRKKVAMLLAYSGQGYFGMQRNRDVDTIEECLLSAMLKADLITQENYDVPQSMAFQRAARTDKGVSAARQVVSLRLASIENVVEMINSHLPPQIRVFDVKRSTKGFNSKCWCDARTYSYTMPTFAFAPSTELVTSSYRITDEVFDKANDILSDFIGTHNFHNFTSGRKADDASSKRYIIDFKCGKPFVENDLQFVTVTVKGQSFMLHQIRKMIGIVIAIMRDLSSRDIIKSAWNPPKVDIPIAPGVGLVLEEVHYDKYNLRYSSDGFHDSLIWMEHSEQIEQFKKEFIYPSIIKAEVDERSMFEWLSTLPLHTYGVREDDVDLPIQRSQTRSAFGKALVTVEMNSERNAVDWNATDGVDKENGVAVKADNAVKNSVDHIENNGSCATIKETQSNADTTPSNSDAGVSGTDQTTDKT